MADKLAKVDKSVAPGNPAGSTRAQHGPLYLEVGAERAEVAEELSLWDAITCAPAQLRPLARGQEFNAFCSLVIRAVEAANDPYGAYITLGLSPFDWAESLSVNTASKLSAFRSEVCKEGGAAAWEGDLEAWRRAWVRRQVPGYRSADKLWLSKLGRTVRMFRIARRCDTDRIDRVGRTALDRTFLSGCREPRLAYLRNCRPHEVHLCLKGVVGAPGYLLAAPTGAIRSVDGLCSVDFLTHRDRAIDANGRARPCLPWHEIRQSGVGNRNKSKRNTDRLPRLPTPDKTRRSEAERNTRNPGRSLRTGRRCAESRPVRARR